jgi:hypothetical protein
VFSKKLSTSPSSSGSTRDHVGARLEAVDHVLAVVADGEAADDLPAAQPVGDDVGAEDAVPVLADVAGEAAERRPPLAAGKDR